MADLIIKMAHDPPVNNVHVRGLGRESVERIYSALSADWPEMFPLRPPEFWTWREDEYTKDAPLTGGTFFWPTEIRHTNQAFGINAETYKEWGLPGHEGIDLAASKDSSIFACLDGEVISFEWQHKGQRGHNYGKHIRIKHADGLTTIYAHLSRVDVKKGEPVYKGEPIGIAGSTGNSTGIHLHLTLKKAGATAAGETKFKGDVIDPSHYLGI